MAENNNRKAAEFPWQIHLVGNDFGAMFGFDDQNAANVKCDDMNGRAVEQKLAARYVVKQK
jgi:hypothetical protein